MRKKYPRKFDIVLGGRLKGYKTPIKNEIKTAIN